MRALVCMTVLCVAALVIASGLGCTNLFPWGSNDIPLVASVSELRLGPGTDVGTFEITESRADLSRRASLLVTNCLDCPPGAIGPVEPAEFTTHGLTPQTMTVHVSRAGLSEGTYTGYVQVYAANGAAIVAVVVVVGPQ